MCRAVELLITPDIAEFPTIGERLAGFDLEPDNSHCAPPLRSLCLFIINPLAWLTVIQGSRGRKPQAQELFWDRRCRVARASQCLLQA